MARVGIYKTDTYYRISISGEDSPEIIEKALDASVRGEKNPFGELKTFIQAKKIYVESVRFAFPHAKTLIRLFTVPSHTLTEIKNMIEYKLKSAFPYKLEDLLYDMTIVSTDDKGYSKVLVAALPIETAEKELAPLTDTDFVPSHIHLSSLCLYRSWIKASRASVNVLLCNIEDGFCEIVAVCNTTIKTCRGFACSPDKVFSRIIKELRQLLQREEVEGIIFQQIVVSARGVNTHVLADVISKELHREVIINDSFCVSSSLLEEVKENTPCVDLLPPELKLQKKRRGTKRIAVYFATLLLLNISLLLNIGYLKLKEKREYLTFLKSQVSAMEVKTDLLRKKKRQLDRYRDAVRSGNILLQLLTELSRLTPQEISLYSVKIKNAADTKNILLSANAPNHDVVLEYSALLRESGLLKTPAVNFIKKSTLEPETVDFEIQAEYYVEY